MKHWLIFTVTGSVFTAVILGGGLVSYLSLLYDYRINKLSEKHEKQMQETMHALNTLLKNEIKQTKHIEELLEGKSFKG